MTTISTNLQTRTATAHDRLSLISLLEAVGLPTEDLPNNLSGFQLVFAGDRLVGSAGVESYADAGLLRSVAVDPAYRNRQIGQRLIDAIRQQAQQTGLSTLYLITTTADTYFGRLGFTPVERINVPEPIAQTQQFSSLCPSSAVVMKQLLKVV
ncbi:GNAT family N-acetyltransferase [Spirosoma taeanense]|uniref:GNAT family N-acetyltransferase n=1 Tax=Spirosoma taeanense TaxID=2735870 RepID=A0A6M5Y6C9_9BACT|nr:arsenic resistance N-acetyltransferase ArsN2 [Spirosoma taeanense]QJW89034.1 GNAT family N-acetyltransferase [Spirosoma taeanense]